MLEKGTVKFESSEKFEKVRKFEQKMKFASSKKFEVQVQLKSFFATQATIKTIEMPETMATDVQDYAVKAIQEFKSENDIANAIKKYMDSQHTPTWNVMCGRSFGAYVTHESKRYIYFSIGHLSILCWKCG